MENYAIKSVAFGGFDKEDVARYIEKASQETEQLRQERDGLRQQLEDLEQEATALRSRTQELAETEKRLTAEVERLAPLETQVEELTAQLDTLRPDAEAHAMLRDQVGAIECEARTRAAELEERTQGRMRQAADLFRQQYQALMSTFETASSHMTTELRRMEVALAQLPRTMDQTGVELDRLAVVLEKNGQSEE